MSDSTITFVILGAVSFFRLPIAHYPEIAPPVINVSGQYPGASAEAVASTVIFIATCSSGAASIDGRHGLDRQHLIDAAGGQVATARADVARCGADGADQRQRLCGGSHADETSLAIRLRRPTSQLLLPLAFGAHAVSTTLTGTPVNVIVNASAENAGVESFALRVRARGRPARGRNDRDRRAVRRAPASAPQWRGVRPISAPTRTLAPVPVAGPGTARHALGASRRLSSRRARISSARPSAGHGDRQRGFRRTRGAAARGGPRAARHARDRRCAPAARDVGALESSLETDPDVLVVDSPELVRRQGVPLGAGAKRALAVLAGMVLLLATGAVEPVVAGLLAAGAIVLFRVLDTDQAYRAVSWTTVVLVAGMLPLSTAMTQTGAAAKLADLLVDVVGGHGPHALLLGLFVLTAVLGQLISNMATALIMIPVALSAAGEIDVSPRPVLMSLTVAAAASFLTPVATPANLMVMRPGGYRFGDYWKLGLPLLILFGVVSILLVPVIWRF
jgi:hypothetical protein